MIQIRTMSTVLSEARSFGNEVAGLALGRRVRKIFLTLIGVLIHANPPTQLRLNRCTNGDSL